ncbi:cell wall-binding repeat-containing protein [Clostridium sp. PL3]|uniref:Cell wall-binding repeat-containing protein n=1 Tax=Clostridium thailandense TaxID=2794346 RepID=A0A949TWP5_9CLOT|nr:cell wall-binding repeat-containing protein [Clostridium thailandense]MBV7272875.1 cell wall-binding repeat-containing protein [Clostridium thailandense]
MKKCVLSGFTVFTFLILLTFNGLALPVKAASTLTLSDINCYNDGNMSVTSSTDPSTIHGLMQAIQFANASSAGSTFVFNITADITNISAQLPTINQSVTITGNGHTISVQTPGFNSDGTYSTNPSNFNLFTINGQGTNITTVEVDSCTLMGGAAAFAGAAISNTNATLKLNDDTITRSGSASYAAGGIYNEYTGIAYFERCNLNRNGGQYGGGFLNKGKMFIDCSSFSENRSLGTGAYGGGAGENSCKRQTDGSYTAAYLYVNNSTFANNSSTELGSAINNFSGTLYVLNSTFSGNLTYWSSNGANGVVISSRQNQNTTIESKTTIVNSVVLDNYTTASTSSYALGNFTNALVYTSSSIAQNLTLINSLSQTTNIGTVTNCTQYNNGNADTSVSTGTFAAGGADTKFLSPSGQLSGTGSYWQPFLVNHTSLDNSSTKLSAVLLDNSTSSAAISVIPCTTAFYPDNTNPVVAYKDGSGNWQYLLGNANADNYIVNKDQFGYDRTNSSQYENAVGATIVETSNLYRLRTVAATGGSVNGATIYGDNYTQGTLVSISAIPQVGYKFTGWNATGTTFANPTDPSQSITMNANIDVTPSFSNSYVIYNANGGSGTMMNTSPTEAVSINSFSDTYAFNSWNTKADGTGTRVTPGTIATSISGYNGTSDLTLYAIWNAPPAISGVTPGNASIHAGESTDFQVSGTKVRNGTLTYKWYAKGSPDTQITNGNIVLQSSTIYSTSPDGSILHINPMDTTLNGAQYYAVVTETENGISIDSASSAVGTLTVTQSIVPDAPTSATATAGDASATVTWTAPVNNGGSPITDYLVEVYNGASLVNTVDTNSTTTSAAITGLTNGTAYTFDVKAVNGVGNSAASNTTNVVTPSAINTAPDAPTSAAATAGDTTATVTWTAPVNNGGSPITDYLVEVYNGASLVNTVDTNSTTTSAAITGLTNGTAYTFDVKAVNIIGNSAASNATSAVTPTAQSSGGSGGASGGSTGGSSSSPSTISGEVIDGDNGSKVSNITATVATDNNGNSTVSMNATEAVLLKQSNGTISQLGDSSKISITTETGAVVAISANGTIQVQNLVKGTDYNFNITYDFGNGQKINIGKMEIKVDSAGNVSLTSALIDPYGIITDAATGKVIEGAQVTLYYANTERNKANGKTPDTIVQLPGIDGFKPNNNKNPQLSDANGAYGFMVFPTSDYYIVATKEGYCEYTSSTIHVEKDIVKWDFKMNEISADINPNAGKFDKNISSQTDVSTTMTLNGFNLVSITNGSSTLINEADYTVNNNVVTIKKSYLAKQNVGTTTLTFNFSGGSAKTLAITVIDTTPQNSTINPNTAEFDRYTLKQADISTTMTLNGNNLVSITTGTSILVKDTDYTVSNDVVTIKKGYLAKQSLGSITLTFNFSAGAVQSLVITIKDSTPSSSGGSGGGGGGGAAAPITPSPAKTAIERLSGQDRVDTALAIAKATYTGKVSKVILVSSENYPDALAGSVLAYKLNAPILLVGSDEADQDKILSYLKDNMDLAGTVYILGGTGVVSKDMEAKVSVSGFKNIIRLGGADRFETAAKISDTIGVKEGTPIVIVSGENYPDALSISSIAAVKQYPIIMVNKNEIPEVEKKEISLIKPGKVYIIGAEGAVSSAVEDQVSQTAAIDKTNIVRLGGADRFETSLKIIQYFDLSGSAACVTSGNNFPDAVAGSVYAAKNEAPMMLVDNNLSEAQKSYLKNANLKAVTIFGGTGVVSKEIEDELTQVLK